jgi:hypothetical protein
VTGTSSAPSSLTISVTKTNGAVVSLGVTNTSGTTDLQSFVEQFANLVNGSSSLQGADGLTVEDVIESDPATITFNVRALSPGYAAALIKARISGASGIAVIPAGNNTLMDNITDLEPRNHLYVAAGTTHLSFTFPFNTATLPDGYHELDAVAYEGTHVRTQTRAVQWIRIQNGSLSSTLTPLVGGENTAIESTLRFAVAVVTNLENPPAIGSIELFSTGGSLGIVSNQLSAAFSVPAANLDLGLHPFYAVVTDTGGLQYRTPTLWFRIVGLDAPFPLQIDTAPTTIVWPAAAGRSYDILETTNLAVPFQLLTSVVPTNSVGYWVETNAFSQELFYRVRVTP